MTKQITIKGFIHWKRPEWCESTDDESNNFHFWRFDSMTSHGYVPVKAVEITFTLPENFDPVTGEVEVLKAKKQALEKEFDAQITMIDTQISKLLAISYEPETVE